MHYFCASVILLCEIILVRALECSPDSSFMPENGVPISEQLPTSAQAIFPTLQFECQAIITGGNIQAVGDLNLDLQIWRPQESTGTFYNLILRRRFRIRSGGGRNVEINASFISPIGIPVRAGDVIGFHSFVSPRLLFDLSQNHEVYYVEAGQGPLCNFSLNGTGVRHKTLPLPSISLTYVNATDKEIQLAEQSLPSIDNTCTPVSFTVDNIVMTTTRKTLTVSSTQSTLTVSSRGTNGSQGQRTTTADPSSSDSESISGPNTTQGVSDDDGFFLALSFTEFILVVVILAVVLISICVVVTIALCCCMFVQHMAHCTGKDEPQISMNMNPVYDTIRTQTGQQRCLGSRLPQAPCTSSQQPTLIALVPPCNQTLLQDSTEAGYLKALPLAIASSTESLNSIITPCQQQNVRHTSSNEDYTYPNLRIQLQEHNQHTSDGYVIVQPDHSVRESIHENECTDTENCGLRGAMDDTL